LREVFEDQAVLDTAYALESIFQETIWIAGPLIVALVIAVTSPEAAVAMLGVLCVAGTSLFLRSPLVRSSSTARGAGHERSAALSSPELRALLGPVALTGVALGAVEVGLPSLALHAGSRPASGLLLAFWSVGSMAGGLWYGALATGSAVGGAVIGPGGVGAPFVFSCLASLLAVAIAVRFRARVQQLV
jgi:hypothetical protein